MPIAVACPQCGFAGQVPDHAEGRTIKCRKCGTGFPVARQQRRASAFPPAPPALNVADSPTFDPAGGGGDESSGQAAGAAGRYQERQARGRMVRWLIVLVCVGFVGVAGLVAGAYFLFSGHGPLAGEPETCRELAERLQARGMQITWSTNGFDPPSIVISEDKPVKVVRKSQVPGRYDDYEPIMSVKVFQFPTAKEAKEKAGVTRAYVYGRFVIQGDAEFIEQIKKLL